MPHRAHQALPGPTTGLAVTVASTSNTCTVKPNGSLDPVASQPMVSTVATHSVSAPPGASYGSHPSSTGLGTGPFMPHSMIGSMTLVPPGPAPSVLVLVEGVEVGGTWAQAGPTSEVSTASGAMAPPLNVAETYHPGSSTCHLGCSICLTHHTSCLLHTKLAPTRTTGLCHPTLGMALAI